MTRQRRTLDSTSLLLVALFALSALSVAFVAASCTGPQTRSDERSSKSETEPQPGAERWESGALLLPKRSPIVGVARTETLLENARRLRSWLVDEPAMYGDEGESYVQRFRAGWNQISRGLGADPFSPKAAEKLGVATTRPAYLGFYPAAGAGRDFVERVESAVREAGELPDDVTVASALESMHEGDREIPSDLTKTVLQRVEETTPRAGLRLVVPVADAQTFLGQLDAAASFAGFRELPRGERDWPEPSTRPTDSRDVTSDDLEPVGYVNPRSHWPALLVRPGTDWVQIDVLFELFDSTNSSKSEGERTAELRSSLVELIEKFSSGRPAAPRPTEDAALSVSADQARTSVFARMQAFQRVLDTIPQLDVSRRNRATAAGLARATNVGENWNLANHAFTGVSYSLYGASEDDYLLRSEMNLHGPVPSEDPSVRPGRASLGIDERTFGLSFSLEPLFQPNWKEWLALDDPRDILNHSVSADRYPGLYLLSLPRNAALALVNLEKMIEGSIPKSLQALYRRRLDLERFELGTSGIGSRSLRSNPRFVGLLTFDEETSEDDLRETLDALPPFIEFAVDVGRPRISGGKDDRLDLPESLETGSLETIDLPASHPAHPMHYYAHLSEESSFLLFSWGVPEKKAEEEFESVRARETGSGTREAVLARIEPATALATLTAMRPDALAPIDPGVLAQRLGPMVLSVEPERHRDVQTLRYRFEMRPPPEL